MSRKTCYFSGRVQGVGFRYTAQHLAMQHAVSGYVRNTRDGKVELVIEGDDREIDEIINSIQQRMEGFVGNVNTQVSPATGEFSDFSIRH